MDRPAGPTSVPPVAPPVIRNLDARLAATPGAQLLSGLPWDGPRLDPDVLEARAMLAWLR